MFSRTAGVLLNISSLPGPYGCGVLGEEAVDFAKTMRKAGLHCWQILPFMQPGAGNSPYTSTSAFAGNLWYIDPRKLVEQGLLTKDEAEEAKYSASPYQVDYEWLEKSRMPLLKKAYDRIDAKYLYKVQDFSERHVWLKDYACFMALREQYGNLPYWKWPDEALREHSASAVLQFMREHSRQIGFWQFVQFIFYDQWMQLKQELEEMDIALIGDMPVYVALDSAELWAHAQLFLLEKPGKPSLVAGTPPDYFSRDGQRWGNPLYNWAEMKKENFQWWIERLRWQLELCHSVRIDHFRSFESFWAIPESKSAKEGKWMPGPGMDLFDAVRQTLGEVPVIAEDLGIIDEKVNDFLKNTGFPGMRVLQFAFDPDADSIHLPHHYTHHCVAYTGTHDNNTTLGYLWEALPKEREFALAYCGAENVCWQEGGAFAPGVRALLRALWQSCACIAIAPIQDFCGYGSDTRMNIPGKPEGNWRYRLTKEALASIDTVWLAKLSRIYRREHPFKQF